MDRETGSEETYWGHRGEAPGEALGTLMGGAPTEGRKEIGGTKQRHLGHSGEALKTLTEDIQESTGTKDVWERHCGHFGGRTEGSDERH